MSGRDEQGVPEANEPLVPRTPEEARLESLLVAFDEALERGGALGAADESDLSDASAVKLNGMRDALRLLDQARSEGFSHGGMADAAPRSSPGAAGAPLVKPSLAGQKIGRFELVSEIGRGGYGVVFLAIDPQIGRQVALKIPRPEVLSTEDTRRRFLREAQAAGALEHPHLIPVFEVGEDGPFCYLATAYCEGPTLAQWLKQRNVATPPLLAAQLVLGLAQGVDHAHQRGVLHRDIKPSNVLLESASPSAGVASENLIPRLTDFGLAKLTEMADDETRSGALVGTPAYMAPEQAEGRLRDVGPATDIYALGVLLYELLACRPPFRGESDVQTLQLVSAGDVPPLRRSQRDIPRDLEAIVLRCLEREPARRYATACDLAADLQRFISGEPTLARPATPVERLVKAARRHPAVAAMVAVLCLAGGLLAIEERWYSRQLGTARAEVEARELERRQHRYVADMSRAHRDLSTNHVQQARELLAKWVSPADQPDLRDFAWRYLWRQLNGEERTLAGHEADIYCVRFSRDGARLATASADGTARIWNPADGKCLRVLQGHDGEVNCVAFSPDGKLAATTGDDGTARVWDLADGSTRHVTAPRQGAAWGVGFSPDGTLLAVCGADRRTVLLDTSNWQVVDTLLGHQDSVGSLEFSHDGTMLATASDDRYVIIWDVATRAIKHQLANLSAATSLSFDDKDKRLLVGTRSAHTVKMWNLETAKLLPLQSMHHEIIHGVTFNPTGERYGVVTKEGVVELHDAIHGKRVRSLHGHAVRVWSLAYSPDGQQLATASADRTVKLWNVAEGNPHLTAESASGASRLDVTPDGKRMIVAHDDGQVVVYDVPTHQVVWRSRREFEVLGDFDGDGSRDSGYFVEGTWRLRLSSKGSPAGQKNLAAEDNAAATSNAAAGDEIRRFGGASDIPVVGDWNGDGTDDLGVYDLGGKWTLQKPEGEESLTFGPTSRDWHRVIPVIGRWNGEQRDRVGLFCLVEGGWVARFQRGIGEARMKVPGVEFDALPLSGRWLAGGPQQLALKTAAGWWSHTVDLKQQKKGVLSLTQSPHFSNQAPPEVDQAAVDAARDLARTDEYLAAAVAVAISPDGKQVAVSHQVESRIKLWDLQTGTRTDVLRVRGERIRYVRYSPDGKMLSVGTEDGEITEFSTATLAEIRRFQSDPGPFQFLTYHPDGQTLVTSNDPGVVRFWDANRKLTRTLADPKAMKIWGIAFSADGQRMATCGQNRMVVLWDLERGRQIGLLTGHTSDVNRASFAPDGRLLATASDDGSVRLWNLAMQQEVFSLLQRPEQAFGVAFTPDGGQLISIGQAQDGTAVQFWSAAPLDTSNRPPVASAN